VLLRKLQQVLVELQLHLLAREEALALDTFACGRLAFKRLEADGSHTVLAGIAAALAHTVLIALPVEAVALAVLLEAARLLAAAAPIALKPSQHGIIVGLTVRHGPVTQLDSLHSCEPPVVVLLVIKAGFALALRPTPTF